MAILKKVRAFFGIHRAIQGKRVRTSVSELGAIQGPNLGLYLGLSLESRAITCPNLGLYRANVSELPSAPKLDKVQKPQGFSFFFAGYERQFSGQIGLFVGPIGTCRANICDLTTAKCSQIRYSQEMTGFFSGKIGLFYGN